MYAALKLYTRSRPFSGVVRARTGALASADRTGVRRWTNLGRERMTRTTVVAPVDVGEGLARCMLQNAITGRHVSLFQLLHTRDAAPRGSVLPHLCGARRGLIRRGESFHNFSISQIAFYTSAATDVAEKLLLQL